jgi:hypothetical protein
MAMRAVATKTAVVGRIAVAMMVVVAMAMQGGFDGSGDRGWQRWWMMGFGGRWGGDPWWRCFFWQWRCDRKRWRNNERKREDVKAKGCDAKEGIRSISKQVKRCVGDRQARR